MFGVGSCRELFGGFDSWERLGRKPAIFGGNLFQVVGQFVFFVRKHLAPGSAVRMLYNMTSKTPKA